MQAQTSDMLTIMEKTSKPEAQTPKPGHSQAGEHNSDAVQIPVEGSGAQQTPGDAATERSHGSLSRNTGSDSRDAASGHYKHRATALKERVSDQPLTTVTTVLGSLFVLVFGFSMQVLNDKINQNTDAIVVLETKMNTNFGKVDTKIDNLDTKIDKLDTEVGTKIDKLETKVETKINDLKNEMNSKFEKIDSQFEKIDSRFEKVDSQFEKIDSRFEKIDSELNKVNDSINDINRNLTLLIATLGKTEEIESVVRLADPGE